MSLVTRATKAKMDASTGMYAPQLTGLYAGEDLDVAAPCYIKSSDGKVYMCNATSANEAAEFAGFTPRAALAGEPITLYGEGSIFRYGTSLTPGDVYYMGATAGRLDTAATTGDSTGLVQAINSTDVRVFRSSPLNLNAVADGALTGTKVGTVADGNVVGGILVIHHAVVAAGANGNTDITLTHKTRIVDVIVKPRTSVASAVCTVKNVTDTMTDAMVAAVAGVQTHAASIAVAYDTIAAGTVLRATFSGGATQPDADIYYIGYRAA